MDPRTAQPAPAASASPDRRALRVVIGERDALSREGLTLLLTRAGFEVVAAEHDADHLVAAAHRLRPDLVVTDIAATTGGDLDGLRAALRIRDRLPRTGVVVLTAHLSRQCALDLLSVGATGVGYLLKQRVADSRRFAADLACVAAGGIVVDPEVTRAGGARSDGVDDRLALLTRRQLHVLSLMAEGLSNAAIAQTLFITEKSVGEHASNLYTTLDLPPTRHEHRRVLAVLRYLAARATTGPLALGA